jgi:hypothetical protein
LHGDTVSVTNSVAGISLRNAIDVNSLVTDDWRLSADWNRRDIGKKIGGQIAIVSFSTAASGQGSVGIRDGVAVLISSHSQSERTADADWSAPVGGSVLVVDNGGQASTPAVTESLSSVQVVVFLDVDSSVAVGRSTSDSVGVETSVIVAAASSDASSVDLSTSVGDSSRLAHRGGVASVDGRVVLLTKDCCLEGSHGAFSTAHGVGSSGHWNSVEMNVSVAEDRIVRGGDDGHVVTNLAEIVRTDVAVVLGAAASDSGLFIHRRIVALISIPNAESLANRVREATHVLDNGGGHVHITDRNVNTTALSGTSHFSSDSVSSRWNINSGVAFQLLGRKDWWLLSRVDTVVSVTTTSAKK